MEKLCSSVRFALGHEYKRLTIPSSHCDGVVLGLGEDLGRVFAEVRGASGDVGEVRRE
ncbi:hypothetical protein GCM10009763_13220 [Dermacoccus profundi]|uniref:Uncharacterized protein n=1 Tax=Dermacoccus profundi TaxID=322602 RepID=A0ABP4NR32_9MICO